MTEIIITASGQAQVKEEGLFFNIHMPMRKYILRMWLLGLIPSLLISTALYALGLINEETSRQLRLNMSPWAEFFVIILIAPILETLILAFILFLLRFVSEKRIARALLSAFIWAVLHALTAPPQGLVILWPFFLFSCSYLAWRRNSWLSAVWVTTCIHALQNLLPALLILFGLR